MATSLETAVNTLINKQTELLSLISTSAATVKRYGPTNAGTISIKPNNDETITGKTWVFGTLITKNDIWAYNHLVQYAATIYNGDGEPATVGSGNAIFWRTQSIIKVYKPITTGVNGWIIHPRVLGLPNPNVTPDVSHKINAWYTFNCSPFFQTNDFVYTSNFFNRFITGDPLHPNVGNFTFQRNIGYTYSWPIVYNNKTTLDISSYGGLVGFQCDDLTNINGSNSSTKLECRWMFGYISNINMNLNVCWQGTTQAKKNGAWNFYAGGNAPNYFAGRVLLGSNVDNGIARLQCSGYGYFENKLIVGANESNTIGASLLLSFAGIQDTEVSQKAEKSWNLTVGSFGTGNIHKNFKIWTTYSSQEGTNPATFELRTDGNAIVYNSRFTVSGSCVLNEDYAYNYSTVFNQQVYAKGTTNSLSDVVWSTSYVGLFNNQRILKDSSTDIARLHHIVGGYSVPRIGSGLIKTSSPGTTYVNGLNINWLTAFRAGIIFENYETNAQLKYNIRNDMRSLWIHGINYLRTANVPGSGTGITPTLETIAVAGNIHGLVVDQLVPWWYDRESYTDGYGNLVDVSDRRFELNLTGRVYGISSWQRKIPGFRIFNFFAGGNAPSYFNGNVKIGNGDTIYDEADSFASNVLKGFDASETAAPTFNFEVLDYTHLEHLNVYYPLRSSVAVTGYTVTVISIPSGIFDITFLAPGHKFRRGETINITDVVPTTVNNVYIIQSVATDSFVVRLLYQDQPTAFQSAGTATNVSPLVELGNPGLDNVPTIDFHCLGKTQAATTKYNDYDVRLQVSAVNTPGYTSVVDNTFVQNGEGRLSIIAKETYLSNYLVFNENPDVAPPNLITTTVPAKRSLGTKIVLYPVYLDNSDWADYAIGIENSNIWFGLPSHLVTTGFKWYGGVKCAMRLGSDGTLNVGFDATVVANKPGIINIVGTASTNNVSSDDSGKLCINGRQVVTNQRPYWSNSFGSEPSSEVVVPTVAAGSNPTKAEYDALVAAFNHLVAALKMHGLLGTSTNGTVVTQTSGVRT